MRHYPTPKRFNPTPGMSRTGRALALATKPAPTVVETHVAMVLYATPEQVTERFTRMMITEYPGPRS